jgi:hypothetical protein
MGPEPFRKVFPCFTWLESFPGSSSQGILVVVHNSISNSALFLQIANELSICSSCGFSLASVSLGRFYKE